MIRAHRFTRTLCWNALLTLVLFSIAWTIGFVGVRPSVLHALGVAVFSYLFWAYSAAGMLVMGGLLLFHSTMSYVPPPIAAIVLSRDEIRSDLLLSGVHGITTTLVNALICRLFWNVSVRAKRLVGLGGILGAVIGATFMLPSNTLPESRVLETVLRYATLPSSAIFRLVHATVPIAEHRTEMPFRQVTVSIGWYILTVAAAFSLLALGVGTILRDRVSTRVDRGVAS